MCYNICVKEREVYTMNYTYEINLSTEGQGENGMNINLKITNLDKAHVKTVAAIGIRGFLSYKIINEQTGEVVGNFYRGLELSDDRDAVRIINEIKEIITL